MDDLDYLTASTCYHHMAKEDFHRVARKLLNQLRAELSDMYGIGAIRSNKGGIAVSGEVTLHLERLYVQVSQPGFTKPPYDTGVMFRECKGHKDYSGGRNNFASMEMLTNTQQLSRLIQSRCTVTQIRGESA